MIFKGETKISPFFLGGIKKSHYLCNVKTITALMKDSEVLPVRVAFFVQTFHHSEC